MSNRGSRKDRVDEGLETAGDRVAAIPMSEVTQ